MNKYFKNLATILFTVSVLTTSIIASPAMASAYEESHNVSTIYTSPLDTPHVGDTKITGKTTPLSSFSIAIYTSEGRLTGTFLGPPIQTAPILLIYPISPFIIQVAM